MKSVLLLPLLVALPSVSLAQTVPAKGANTIAVVLPDSGIVVWKKTAQVLTMRGYSLKATDKDLLTLSTESKSTGRAGEVVIRATVIRRTVMLGGNFTTAILDGSGARITYRGMQGSPFMVAWNELQEVAKALGGALTYKINP